jgi:dTDP-4-amino-4,6-dideoxygalactose transaminase
MDAISGIAARHGLALIEDAAHALDAAYRGRPLGSLGALAAVSFHETKNLISGEGGALLVNDPALAARAEVVREKGTNRGAYFRGEVDKYTWVDVGSSFLPSDIIAAFLWAQLEQADTITQRRRALWERYHAAFAGLEREQLARRPVVPGDTAHNAHCYYLLLPDAATRTRFIETLRADGVQSVFHYVPLHSSPAGRRFGRASGSMSVTDSVAERLARLPLWIGLEPQQDHVIERVRRALGR